MNIDAWLDTYHPVANKSGNGSGFALGDHHTIVHEVFDPDIGAVLDVDPDCVWTLLEVDGNSYIVPGLHFVNREGYLITDVPYSGDFVEIPVFEEDIDE